MTDNKTKIVISAETAQAQAALKSFEGSFKNMLGVVGGALSVGAFAGLIKSSIDLQDELGSLSAKTGISARDLSGLKFAADQNGSSLELVSKAVKELSINMTSTPDKFAKLGINAGTATEALAQIADLVKDMPDGMKKTALLAELMGKKVGPDMAEFLSQGGDAMRQYIERGKDIYNVTDEGAASAKQFKDQMAELEARSQGVGIAIANLLLPGLNETAAAMNKLAVEGHPVLALWRGLAGMGKVPWDLLFPPEDLKKSLSSGGMVDDLAKKIKTLEHERESIRGSGFGLINTDKIDREIMIFKNQIETIKKHAAELDKPAPLKNDKPAIDKNKQKAIDDLLASGGKSKNTFDPEGDFWFAVEEQREKNRRKMQEEYQRGDAVVSGLSTDFSNDSAQKQRDLNSPLMSESDRQHAENLAAIAEKAARANEKIEALNLSDEQRIALTAEVTALTNAQVAEMEALRKQIDANNASWQYGAQSAMRAYVDEASNVAKQTEQMFSSAFAGMEDAMVAFVQSGKLDFKSLIDSIIADMIRMQIKRSFMMPLMGLFGMGAGGGALAGQAGGNLYANGGVFGAGVTAFANGGVVNSPTIFPFADGGSFQTGLMGEAGPEAIMPLKRDSKGRLGVSGGSGGSSIVYSPVIQIDSRTDQAEVARLVDRAVKNGNEQLLDKLRRQGQIS